LIRVRIEIIGEPLWMRHWTSGFHNPWNLLVRIVVTMCNETSRSEVCLEYVTNVLQVNSLTSLLIFDTGFPLRTYYTALGSSLRRYVLKLWNNYIAYYKMSQRLFSMNTWLPSYKPTMLHNKELRLVFKISWHFIFFDELLIAN